MRTTEPQEAMGSIKSIVATRVLGEFNYRILYGEKADDGRVEIIYAPNGRGKTNLLRAVDNLLTPTPEGVSALIDAPMESLRVETQTGGAIEFRKQSAFATTLICCARIAESSEPVEISLDAEAFTGRFYRRRLLEDPRFEEYIGAVGEVSRGAVYLGDNRLLRPVGEAQAQVAPPRQLDRSSEFHPVREVLAEVEKMFMQRALASISHGRGQDGVYAEITKATLAGKRVAGSREARSQLEQHISSVLQSGEESEQYGLVSLRQVRTIDGLIRSVRRNAKGLSALYTVIDPYLKSLDEQIETLSPTLNLIDTYVRTVNSFFDGKSVSFHASVGFELKSRRGERLDPEALSSGERHMLLILSHAVLASESHKLVIVDEPELSLGLEWQRGLVEGLLRCTDEGDTQFLLASHSIQLMSSVDPERVVSGVEAETGQ